jgi:polyhydroxyalkanoate synthase
MVLATIDGLRHDAVDLFGWEWVLRAARRIRRGGIVEGRDLTLLFSLRQANDRLWRHWVNNYLLGEEPQPNAVSTWSDHDQNLPGALQADHLSLYSTNALLRPNVASVLGEPIDLTKVEADLYVIAGARDATSPWKASFRATEAFGGRSEFILSPTGHGQTLLPGSRNPLARYFAGGELGRGPDHWRATAEERSGSWWGHWSRWIIERSGPEVPAPDRLGNRRFRPGDPAPGRYVVAAPR